MIIVFLLQLIFLHAVKKSDVIFIAVGTPSKANGETDLSQVGRLRKELVLR